VAWPNGGTCVTDGTQDSPSAMLAASASVSLAGEIQAKFVNYDTREVMLTVQLGTSAAAGTLAWMSGPTADTVNSFVEPRRVGVQETAVALEGGKVELTLPAWSVSILKVARVDSSM
jgi:alpha-L-arabinofuranosidase